MRSRRRCSRVCEFLDIDLAVLWQTTALDETDLWQTHWYVRGGGEGPGVMRQEQWPYVASQMLAGRTFRLASLDDFPPEAAVDRENAELLRHQVQPHSATLGRWRLARRSPGFQ